MTDRQKMKVKVFGLQRSGTNYLQQVILNCFHTELEFKYGWKHALPEEKYLNEKYEEDMFSVAELLESHRYIIPVVIYKDYKHWTGSIEREPKNFFEKRADPSYFYWLFHYKWHDVATFIHYEDFIYDFQRAVKALGHVIMEVPYRFIKPTKVGNSLDWKPSDAKKYLIP